MKALTLTQPWATLVAIGEKRIETRSWRTTYRGPLAIHAAKGFPPDAREMCREEPFDEILWNARYRFFDDLPCGVVIATAQLIDCIHLRETHDPIALAAFDAHGARYERAFGNYGIGRYMWLLTDVVRIEPPVPARGALGLWDWQPEPVPA